MKTIQRDWLPVRVASVGTPLNSIRSSSVESLSGAPPGGPEGVRGLSEPDRASRRTFRLRVQKARPVVKRSKPLLSVFLAQATRPESTFSKGFGRFGVGVKHSEMNEPGPGGDRRSFIPSNSHGHHHGEGLFVVGGN